jgi:hypothetical protein
MAGLLVVALTAVAHLSPAEVLEQERATVRKTEDRLHFELPPDWPVEKRGGILAPIPMEEYLGKKFKTVESRLQSIEQRLGGLDLRLRVLEEAMKTQSQGLKSKEAVGP